MCSFLFFSFLFFSFFFQSNTLQLTLFLSPFSSFSSFSNKITMDLLFGKERALQLVRIDDTSGRMESIVEEPLFGLVRSLVRVPTPSTVVGVKRPLDFIAAATDLVCFGSFFFFFFSFFFLFSFLFLSLSFPFPFPFLFPFPHTPSSPLTPPSPERPRSPPIQQPTPTIPLPFTTIHHPCYPPRGP